jgi:hypothetical protein
MAGAFSCLIPLSLLSERILQLMEVIMAKRIHPEDRAPFCGDLEAAEVLPLGNQGQDRPTPGAWATWNFARSSVGMIHAPAALGVFSNGAA